MSFKNFLTSLYSFFCETPDARVKRKEKEKLNDIRKATGVKSPDALYKDDPMFELLSWFYTTKGLDTFKKYMSSQKYFEQDKLEAKDGGLRSILEFSEFYRDEALPYIFFYGFICKVGIPSIKYCADKKSNDKIYTILVKILSDSAKPYYRDQDGEPHKKENLLDYADFLLIDKNIVLKFMTTFRNFDFIDDEKGTLLEKLQIICFVLLYLQSNLSNSKMLLDETWLFETSTYLNEFGILKSPKTFLKGALNSSSDKAGKKYFKEKLEDYNSDSVFDDDLNNILNYEPSKRLEGDQEKRKNYSLTVEYYDDLLEIEMEKQVTVYAQSEAEAIIAARNMVKGFLKATIN